MFRISLLQSMTARSRSGSANFARAKSANTAVEGDAGHGDACLRSRHNLVFVHPAEIELEVIVPAGGDPEISLANVAAECKKASLTVTRVLALPESYLRSYQPSGPWPAGPARRILLNMRAGHSRALKWGRVS